MEDYPFEVKFPKLLNKIQTLIKFQTTNSEVQNKPNHPTIPLCYFMTGKRLLEGGPPIGTLFLYLLVSQKMLKVPVLGFPEYLVPNQNANA